MRDHRACELSDASSAPHVTPSPVAATDKPHTPRARHSVRSWRNRVRYRFDRLLARGTWAVLLWLGLITLLVVMISAVLLTVFPVSFTGDEDASMAEDFWQSLLRVIDPGTMAEDVGWGRRILALIVTITGLLIAGTLIGLIASGVEQRVEALRRGRSLVVESGHFVVLGRSPRLRIIIDQLTKADPKTVVVVLADHDAPEMDQDVRADLDPSLGQRLIFRSGDPQLESSLEITNVDEARAVIVLADADDIESDVVTTALNVGRVIGFERTPIVVEVPDAQTREKLLLVTGPNLHPVVAAESVSRVAALVLRQAGLGEVVEALIDAGSPGVHVKELPELVGSSFGDAVFALGASRPIGLIGADDTLRLNPPRVAPIQPGDHVVAIAAEHAAIAPGPQRSSPGSQVPIQLDTEPTPMNLLIVGWNHLGSRLLAEFDRFAPHGSSGVILYDETITSTDAIGLPSTTNLTLRSRPGSDPSQPLRETEFSSIIVLAYGDDLPAPEADGRTLIDLAIVRNELSVASLDRSQLLVQLLDADRIDLADLAGINGFVIGDGIGSYLISQLAAVPERQAVLGALYDPDRSSLHLMAFDQLGIPGPVSFEDVIGSTYASNLLAIGWITSVERGRQVVLSPPLTAVVDPSNQIIVIG